MAGIVSLGDRWIVLTAAASLAALTFLGVLCPSAQTTAPHSDPIHGVRRILDPWAPRGSCVQCHNLSSLESGAAPSEKLLIAVNSNQFCFTADGSSPCHQQMPSNYPAVETHRIPVGFPDAGYFEYNSGGAKIHGVNLRSRWTGASLFDDTSILGPLLLFASPHRNDPDMPRLDGLGDGSCLNCHDPHETDNPFDLLVNTYRGIGGFDEPTYPTRYALCFNCHSAFGPAGMNVSGRLIQDFYDSSLNGATGGHQINLDPDIALSWPPHVRQGDKLPCYNCHNPHGSRGYNNQGANVYLISDQRPGWWGLTDTKNDDVQARRFCLGCHIPADGVPGSQQVEGIIMNTLSNELAHQSTSTDGCFECHGSDYDRSNDHNVHNPKR